jgi:hypothetical protein
MGDTLPSLLTTSAVGAAFWETIFLFSPKQNCYIGIALFEALRSDVDDICDLLG